MTKPRGIGEAILEMRERGCSYDEIVVALNCSKGTVAYHCGVGQKEAWGNRQQKKRMGWRRYVQLQKTGKPCTDCGNEYPYYMMDFDHRPGVVKLRGVGQLSQFSSLTEIKDEISKCDLVCANCHRTRTWSRMVKGGGEVPEDFDWAVETVLG